jgi:DNA-directed RNA polymerase subunit RPC12/RpoP
MPQSESSQIDQIKLYRPPCSKCGALTALARIEPAPEPDHDLRTFECSACGHEEVVKIKFK